MKTRVVRVSRAGGGSVYVLAERTHAAYRGNIQYTLLYIERREQVLDLQMCVRAASK
jgi:hypothetical protein